MAGRRGDQASPIRTRSFSGAGTNTRPSSAGWQENTSSRATAGPKAVTMAVSAASRPWATRTRPSSGASRVASKATQCAPMATSNQACMSGGRRPQA